MTRLIDISFLATGIGSLPHTNIEESINLITSIFTDAPFWPQLSRISKSEDMITQAMQGFPGLKYDTNENRYFVNTECDEFFEQVETLIIDYESIIDNTDYKQLDKYALTRDFSAAFSPWLEKVKQIKPPVIKGQLVGPFTFATSLTDQNKKSIYYDETIRELIGKFLSLKALWQILMFKKANKDAIIIISLDEPSISQYGSTAFLSVEKSDIVESLNTIADIIHDFGGLSFIHCCGNTDWSLVTSSKIKILNFDAYNFHNSITLYPDDIKSFLDNNGIIAWGLVPTLDPNQLKVTSKEILVELFENIIEKLVKKGVNKEKLLYQSIVTTACGTSVLTLDDSEKALKLTSDIANTLRSKYIN